MSGLLTVLLAALKLVASRPNLLQKIPTAVTALMDIYKAIRDYSAVEGTPVHDALSDEQLAQLVVDQGVALGIGVDTILAKWRENKWIT